MKINPIFLVIGVVLVGIWLIAFNSPKPSQFTTVNQVCESKPGTYRGFARKGFTAITSCNDEAEYKKRKAAITPIVQKHFPELTNHFKYDTAGREYERNSPLPEKYSFKVGYQYVEFNMIGAQFNELKVECYHGCDPVLPTFNLETYKPRICALAIESFQTFPEFNMYRFWFTTDDGLTHWVFRFMANQMDGITQDKCVNNINQYGLHGKKGVFFKKTKIPPVFFEEYNKWKNSPYFYDNFQKYIVGKIKIPGYTYGIGCGRLSTTGRGISGYGGGGFMTSTDNQIDDWRENAEFRRALLLILRAAKTECKAPSIDLMNDDGSIELSLMPKENLSTPWGFTLARIFEER